MTEKDDKKERTDTRTARDSAGQTMSEDLDPIVDTMEAGVFTYISSILGELYKSNHVRMV